MNEQDTDFRTAIWLAVAMGNRYLVERLLKAGANPRIANEDGADATDINAIILKSIEGNTNGVIDDSDPRLSAK